MSKDEVLVPEVLPVSPLSLVCPFCRAEPNQDCGTVSGAVSVVHIARIKAAARQDVLNLSFIVRPDVDGTFHVFCSTCFMTVATAQRETELAGVKTGHKCPGPSLISRQRKGIAVARDE